MAEDRDVRDAFFWVWWFVIASFVMAICVAILGKPWGAGVGLSLNLLAFWISCKIDWPR